ncbi:hypothetical protein QRX60_03085 [Amycolatopsis mongoliensis]|uniref:Uncharacterized protein n=1 Tax=Amycolatopsis mongoliensis TaxID=715475 RepID=A0A9Y2JQF4_9PSEU|nr:hypothetical protein [Amycolatopsis sp. 4-36]WIY02876.1 hypothetical protein QRX60_03085 [Amycolatopsis sp. 4-36]
MDDTDLVQTGIGLLASVYRLRLNLQGEGDESGSSGYPELLEGALDFTMTADSTVPPEYAAEVQDVVKQAIDELARRQEAILRGLLLGFVKIVEAYETDQPGPDVLQLLQQLSLEVAVE